MPCATPCDDCKLKPGIPILFTRYAVGYSAQGSGMAALDSLKPARPLQIKPSGVTISTTKYNLRMLRAGYLYVYIERKGLTPEWFGYAVHPHGYLSRFTVRVPSDTPPKPACEVETRGAISSMVWVSDAQNVSELSYMFHPDPIDFDHLTGEIQDHRGEYMQRFDVAAWAGGNHSLSDSCQSGQLNSAVMEFSAIYDKAVQKVGCEQHYGLMGTHGSERGWGNYTEAHFGSHFEKVRHETRQADGSLVVTDIGAASAKVVGPYISDVLDLPYATVHGPRLKKVAQMLQDNKGAVVACEDAVGIAQELSLHHLTAAEPYVAWLKQVDEKDTANPGVSNEWKHAAGESIKTMEAAIYKKAMLVYDAETDRLERVRQVMDQRHAYPVDKTTRQRPDGSLEEVDVRDLEAQRKKDLDNQIESRDSDRHLISDVEARVGAREGPCSLVPAALLDRRRTRRERRGATRPASGIGSSWHSRSLLGAARSE